MFKKSFAAVIFSFLMVLSLVTPASAQEDDAVQGVPYYDIEAGMSNDIQAAIEDVNKVNAKIEAEIVKTQEKAERVYSDYITKLANEKDAKKQQKLTASYEKEISKMISKLQEKAEKITLAGVQKAEAAGLTVDVILIDVQFGDRTAKVDPIVVVSW